MMRPEHIDTCRRQLGEALRNMLDTAGLEGEQRETFEAQSLELLDGLLVMVDQFAKDADRRVGFAVAQFTVTRAWPLFVGAMAASLEPSVGRRVRAIVDESMRQMVEGAATPSAQGPSPR